MLGLGEDWTRLMRRGVECMAGCGCGCGLWAGRVESLFHVFILERSLELEEGSGSWRERGVGGMVEFGGCCLDFLLSCGEMSEVMRWFCLTHSVSDLAGWLAFLHVKGFWL